MINAYLWDTKAKKLVPKPPDLFQRKRQDVLGPEQVLWIDLDDPTPEEEALVLQQFLPVHLLTFEDITRQRREPDSPPHFPKVEEFPDYLFVIVNPLTEASLQASGKKRLAGEQVEGLVTQLSAVLTHEVLVTHHYHPLRCVKHLATYVGRHEHQAARGPDYLFHLILDSTVDQYAPVLDHIDDHLDELELAVMQRPRPRVFAQLLRLKRQVVTLRKTLIYEREVLVRLARGEFELVEERETVYYRNVYDHLVRFTDLIESSRDMTADLMQSYLASTSNHLNQIMKVLTMISTIILPMSLISGVYGMNFERLVPDTQNPWGFEIALGLMTLSGVTALSFFYWRRWL